MIHTPIRTGAILTGALAITLGLGACTFVPVTTEGQHVRVATASDVRNCQRLGSTTVTITEKVGFVRRPPEKLAQEAEATARNAAAKDWNGNTIVPMGPLQDGRQVFDVYRC
ncbi:DUF4156 domain-containing protein [Thioalkalivibrio sulfidiphilus]|uniref:Putative lipoprotein n=1 Tax=Thioalkalivibrio sulfidiphilus (strain HL-EbGR7) TaxID=396588 RepID=B8GMX7_THISH|nr:DUF4156 domain-containing protein [Thioalkalivibrio sulfidiphilus]ACL73792.1 putative lipoprotein [Thioalkalivibrio sulfidiphilus HL-EbGr7]